MTDIQSGWRVGAPTFAAMSTILASGNLNDKIDHKKTLLIVAICSNMLHMLSIGRIIGGSVDLNFVESPMEVDYIRIFQ